MAKRGKLGTDMLALLVKKRKFMTAVFATLIFQLLVTYTVMYTLKDNKDVNAFLKRFGLIALILQLCLLLVLAFVPMPPILKLALFTLVSVVTGIVLIRVIQRYGDHTVRTALLGATSVFSAMFVFGLALAAMGIDIGFMGIYLFAALIGLVISQLLHYVINKGNQTSTVSRIITAVTLVIFSIFVVFDTNTILLRDYPGNDFVMAALDYFLDFVNIFTSLTSFANE